MHANIKHFDKAFIYLLRNCINWSIIDTKKTHKHTLKNKNIVSTDTKGGHKENGESILNRLLLFYRNSSSSGTTYSFVRPISENVLQLHIKNCLNVGVIS